MTHSGNLRLIAVLAAIMPAFAQKPEVTSVLNAASYLAPPAVGHALQPHSLANVKGLNLASGTFTASAPYPKSLGGTSVTFAGAPAPLVYVSPTQINLQVPTMPPNVFQSGLPTEEAPVPVVVQTANGASDPLVSM